MSDAFFAALAPEARFECADIREARFGEADAVVILDVLHYIGPDAQRDVLLVARYDPGATS